MTSSRLLAAALARDLRPGKPGNLTGRIGWEAETPSLVPPQAPVRTDLFRPAGTRPRCALLVVQSSSNDREPLRRIATGLARAGVLVVAPDTAGQMDDSGGEMFSGGLVASAEQSLESALDLAGPDIPLRALGVSTAGGALLVASTLPTFAGRLSTIFTVGAPFDLRNVLVFALTGKMDYMGEANATEPDSALREAAIRQIEARIPPSLGAHEGVMAGLACEQDPVRVVDRVRQIDNGVLLALWAASPASVIPAIVGRVVVMHSKDDRCVPFTEALRLHQALAGRGPADLRLLEGGRPPLECAFTGPGAGRLLREILAEGASPSARG